MRGRKRIPLVELSGEVSGFSRFRLCGEAEDAVVTFSVEVNRVWVGDSADSAVIAEGETVQLVVDAITHIERVKAAEKGQRVYNLHCNNGQVTRLVRLVCVA